MFENVAKEDLITGLNEMGGTVHYDLGIFDLKPKLMQ
ncbi:hypothetical protein TNIN_234021, partial [Trichonephila inaurata madagascariensis]